MLMIEHVDVGPGNKLPRFLRLCEAMGSSPERTLYFGDDINDLPAMEAAGFVACPADAHPIVRGIADVVLEANGGRHAARELSDRILRAKGADLSSAAQ
jgi:3-deoxy-D-manno-octulosonate 8-phosphate phosphatase (KDO 8-P phosphatase)